MEKDDELKINWFPGHMTAALRMMQAELKNCDLVIYMLDARCAQSCLNPKFREFTDRRPVLFVLNKIDLASHGTLELLEKSGVMRDITPNYSVVTMNSVASNSRAKAIAAIQKAMAEKIATYAARGVKRTIRCIVVGVTNCGKSTFINNLAGKAKAITGDRPGVTQSKLWLPVTDHLHIMDTPGTLWPSFDNRQVALNLAYVGSIRDEVMDLPAVTKCLIADLERLSPGSVQARFGAVEFDDICRKRGYILKGGVLDDDRAAKAILTEFRAGKLGKFNLDTLLESNGGT